MKKIVLLAAAFAAGILTASAQVEIGLKVSPSITSLRADGPSANPFSGGDSKVSFGGGLIVDYFFGENYALGTGLFLTGKGGSYTYTELAGTPFATPVTQKLTIQYLEVPATVKLFTNEVAPDVRLFFQLGASLAVPISARINDEKFFKDPLKGNAETSAYSHVFPVDANALLGLGAEYQLGTRTKVLGGLSYHRGLVDLDHYFEKERDFKDVNIRNSVFSLDLGMKF
jgi:Outer membrane protein beta-barrel domain